MAFVTDIDRITRALNWIGALALAGGLVVVMWALWGTRGVDDFRTAVLIAAAGFGLPSIVALGLAWLLDPLTEGAGPAPPAARVEPVATAPVRPAGLVRRAVPYAIAAVLVAAAALTRWWLTPMLGVNAPFMTFFLAVGVAAWIGGFGPAAFATLLCMLVAWNGFLGSGGPLPDLLGALVALGVFAATALALGGITATAHATSVAARRMLMETSARQASLLAVEATLRSERERLKGLLELIDDAVLLTDGAGLVEHMNPAAERLTRWRLADARGRAVAEVVPLRNATTRAPHRVLPVAAEPGAPQHARLVVVDRDGVEHAVDDHVKAIGPAGAAPSSHVVVLRLREPV